MSQDNLNQPLDAEILIIGSGFGGSVMAARLIEAGLRVVVVERGPWRNTLPVRSGGIRDFKPLPRDGGMLDVLRSLHLPIGPKNGLRVNKFGYLDVWVGQGIRALTTSNVGGGSHIWGAIMDRPAPGFWDDRAPSLSDAIMHPHYERVGEELGAVQPKDSRQVPNHTDHAWSQVDFFTPLAPGEQPPMGILYPSAGEPLLPVTDMNGITRLPIDFTQHNGIFGSPGGSKTTVDAAYLLPALQLGLIVRDMHEVRRIAASDGGYQVTVADLRRGHQQTLHVHRVVVAAGTMNTNALLLASRASGGLGGMQALGLGIGANGDILARWSSMGHDGSIGTPVTGRIKIAGHADSGYFIIARVDPPPVPRILRGKLQKAVVDQVEIVAMSQDAADGRMWMEGGRLRLCFDLSCSPGYERSMKALDALSAMSGVQVKYDSKVATTAHPMGGCRIGASDESGLVDGSGRVYGHRGLYIADASVFPQPIGAPPSLSIAAWSSHVAERLIAEMERQGT